MTDRGSMEMVCGIAEKALREVAREADLTKPGDAELVKNLVGIMYKADKMIEGEDGYSRAGNWYAQGDYGRSYADGNYNNGASYARRRDSMGRYSRMNYSRGTIMEHLDSMMADAENEQQREKIRRFKEQMETMM